MVFTMKNWGISMAMFPRKIFLNILGAFAVSFREGIYLWNQVLRPARIITSRGEGEVSTPPPPVIMKI